LVIFFSPEVFQAFSRWTVPSLAGLIRQLKEAREMRSANIKDFKFRLFAEFDKDRSVWLRAVRVMAELDCLFSLAKSSSALGEPACRPQFIEGDVAWLDFEELRHPAMALRTKSDFIPNNVKLGGTVGRIALLTGLCGLGSFISRTQRPNQPNPLAQDQTWGSYVNFCKII
jgi:DNA mismatch repair protein MSH6